jgi:hypothetical protein
MTAPEVFVLSCVKHSDKEASGDNALLLADLYRMLRAIGGYEKGGGPTGVIRKLEERGLVVSRRISQQQKQELFPGSRGKQSVVLVLTQQGRQTLEDFREQVNLAIDGFIDRLVKGLSSQQSRVTKHATAHVVQFILGRFKQIAPELLRVCYSSEVAAATTDASDEEPEEGTPKTKRVRYKTKA